MIPTWPAALATFGLAATFFTALGLPMARAMAPRGVPALGIAPALGWATYTVLALPVLSELGFGTTQVWLFSAAAAGLALLFWRRCPPSAPALPRWTLGLAAILGLFPLMAIMPKGGASGLLLAPPLFDHVKIAVVDGILREGLPVPNPFYGAQRGTFTYYYLWHFSVALLARLLGQGGWGAEAAMTGFTGFAAIALITSLTKALGGRAAALIAAAALCIPGALRPVLAVLAGDLGTNPFIPRKSDIGGWLNQSAWVPQHLAAACCVVLSALLMLRLAEAGSMACAVLLGLTVAAGFECSTWVGGITFAVAGSLIGARLLWAIPNAARRRFLLQGGAASLVAAASIAPFVVAQWHMVAAQQLGAPVALLVYPTLGRLVPPAWQAALDLPAFWLVLLPFQFPALIPLAMCAASRPATLRLPPETHRLAGVLVLLAAACLAVSWLLRSTIDNNDLGWRAVLPALLVLPAFAARMGENLLRTKPRLLAFCALLAALGLPQAATMIREYAAGVQPGAPKAFSETTDLWPAIRRHTQPTDRIATNPLLAQSATFWPVNIAWALLSDRASCYAGRESVIAYGNVSRTRLEQIDARFTRFFSGHAAPGDIEALADIDDCDVIAVIRTDGAWDAAPEPNYTLVESSNEFRIFKRKKSLPRSASLVGMPRVGVVQIRDAGDGPVK